MSGIFSILGLTPADDTYINTIGQERIFSAAQDYLEMHEADLQTAYTVFLQDAQGTETYKERYKLPGGGYLQRMGRQARTAAVRAVGEWDVAYPIENWGAAIEYTRIDAAMMTVSDMDLHMQSVTVQDVNTRRYEMLGRLFDNAQRAFEDKQKGNLLIEGLANGDSVLYPPKMGNPTLEETRDRYLVSGYTSANISDTNNPLETIRAELEGDFGTPTGYGNIVVFIHEDESASIEALADFVEVTDIHVTPGDDTATTSGLPNVPGRVIGRASGVWVVEWRNGIPSGYMIGIDIDQPAPLKMRRYPAATGLSPALTLVAENQQYPFTTMHYEAHFGFGVANRLNGVVMQLKASGTYDIPALYA